jgi:diketogulonate reductase-like aldo/keto reductase
MRKTMPNAHPTIPRRRFLTSAALGAGALFLPQSRLLATTRSPYPEGILLRKIPSSREAIPAIGMGTYITFNVGRSPQLLADRTKVLAKFFQLGGGMIDSSPMYGTAEAAIGECLQRVQTQNRLFSATKIWTPRDSEGPEQIEQSKRLWGLNTFDLFKVHNLVNWESHLRLLRARKDAGEIRYLGVTTSHGRRHADLEALMRNEPIDFVQLTYNVLDREADERLIPLAAERGIAVIANRPYQGGHLMDRYQSKPLPDWCEAMGVRNWADFFLKFIVAHPAVTCAIPATSRVDHMAENMGALRGRMPDEADRRRMIAYVEGL